MPPPFSRPPPTWLETHRRSRRGARSGFRRRYRRPGRAGEHPRTPASTRGGRGRLDAPAVGERIAFVRRFIRICSGGGRGRRRASRGPPGATSIARERPRAARRASRPSRASTRSAPEARTAAGGAHTLRASTRENPRTSSTRDRSVSAAAFAFSRCARRARHRLVERHVGQARR